LQREEILKGGVDVTKLSKKKILLVVIAIFSVIVSVLYIIFDKPKDTSSIFPDTINIDSKYYLQKMTSLNYTITDYKNELFIINDNSSETDFSMGVCSFDGNMLISPIYKEMCFVNDETIKGWKTETEVYYFDVNGHVLDHGEYIDLKDTYEVEQSSLPLYTIEEFQSTIYSNDENGNPKKILGKYVVYGTTNKEIVFPKNTDFKEVTIANVTGKVFVGDVYDEIYYYSHDDKMVLVKKDNQVYYCDMDGNNIFTVDCKFVEDENGNPCFARKGLSELFPINMFNRGYAITVKGEKYGLINLEGKTIIDFNYDTIKELPYNLYIAINGEDVAICDISRNEGLISEYFKNIQSFEDIIILYDDNANQSIVYSIEMNL